MSGGDDYELLFTLPQQHKAMVSTWREQLDLEISIIGVIEHDEGIRCVKPDGSVFQPRDTGFEHFRRNT